MNLNYHINKYSLENYTNYLINQKMNEFIRIFEKDKDKYFILDYKDDLLSLICYRILKNIQQISPFKFKLYLYGKIKNTKKYIVKKEKKIYFLKSKIKSNNTIIIQPFNPLYNVAKTNINFKDFDCPIWRPLEKFIPEQIKQTQVFYQIGYIQRDKIQIDTNPVIQQFNRFCNKDKNLIDFSNNNYHNDIALVKLTGNNDEDTIILNQIEDFDGLIFYFYKDTYPQMLDSEFSLFLKNKANIPDETNINQSDMIIEIMRKYNSKPIYYGQWDLNEKLNKGEN